MKIFKNLFSKLKFKKNKTHKLPTVFFNRETSNNKPLTKQKNLEKIAKRSFKKNAPINWLGKLTKISRWIWLTIIIGIFLATCYVTFFTKTFHIQKIIIFEGEQESTNLQIRKITEPLRNRNIFLFSTDELAASIVSRVDNINNINIVRKIPNEIQIKYEKFEDVANINNLIGRVKVRKTFIMNENGILTEEDKISTTLPTITIESEKAYTVKDQIITSDNIKYIIETKNYFEEKFNLKTTEIKYLPTAQEVRLVTERNFEIWIDMAVSYKEQLNKLKNAIPKINVYEGELQYVDLRIQSAEGQKIIYR